MISRSENKSGSCQVSAGCCRTGKTEEGGDINCISSSFTNTVSREGNASRCSSTQLVNPPSRFLSRFSINPGNLSFRLTRGNSLGSARSYPASSMGFTISNEEECVDSSSTSVDRNYRPQGCDFFPACFTSRSNSTPDFSGNFQDNQQSNLDHDVPRNINSTRVDCSPNTYSHLYHSNTDDAGMRNSARRVAAREPAERNVRFSRTLSVGRLRDRVLRRTPTSDLELYHFQQDREGTFTHQITDAQVLGHAEVEASSDDNSFSEPVSSDNVQSRFPNPFYGSQNNSRGAPRSRETRYRDLLDHRSNFIERRRRIRSQVF